MAKYNFSTLLDHYLTMIEQMPDTFTSHKFILHLARQHQALYIEALFAYRNSPTPFKIVHGILARHLNAYPQIVTNIGNVESIDIFTQEEKCSQWQKV